MLKLSCTKVHDLLGITNFKVKMFFWNTLFTFCSYVSRHLVPRNVENICPGHIVPAMRPKNLENFNPCHQWLICNFSQLFLYQIHPTAYKNQGIDRVRGIISTQYQSCMENIRKWYWTVRINQGLPGRVFLCTKLCPLHTYFNSWLNKTKWSNLWKSSFC